MALSSRVVVLCIDLCRDAAMSSFDDAFDDRSEPSSQDGWERQLQVSTSPELELLPERQRGVHHAEANEPQPKKRGRPFGSKGSAAVRAVTNALKARDLTQTAASSGSGTEVARQAILSRRQTILNLTASNSDIANMIRAAALGTPLQMQLAAYAHPMWTSDSTFCLCSLHYDAWPSQWKRFFVVTWLWGHPPFSNFVPW
jgi:hypothetical protein